MLGKFFSFFYDVCFIRKTSWIYYFCNLICIPFWLFLRLTTRISSKQVILLATQQFGHQLMDFQGLNQLALNVKNFIYFNHHPYIAGEFIYKEQLEQIRLHRNIRKMNHVFVIIRIFAQSLENFVASRFNFRRQIFFTSLRECGFDGSLLIQSNCSAFPKFNDGHLAQFRKILAVTLPELNPGKSLIAVHSRSGNFPKYREPERVYDVLRNTSFNELNFISSTFDTTNFNFLRIGHYESFELDSSRSIIDLRKQIQENSELQLSVFALINGYVGSSSGPVSFFIIQKKPCLLVSTYPIENRYPSDPQKVMVIPKVIFDLKRKRLMHISEQFNPDFMKLQSSYNDRFLIMRGLEAQSLPFSITRKIYLNWQDSVLKKDSNSEWIKDSIHATEFLRKSKNLNSLPIIPVEFFEYLNAQTDQSG